MVSVSLENKQADLKVIFRSVLFGQNPIHSPRLTVPPGVSNCICKLVSGPLLTKTVHVGSIPYSF